MPILALAALGLLTFFLLNSRQDPITFGSMYATVIVGLLALFSSIMCTARTAGKLADLLFVSLFVLLNAPLWQVATAGTDHYGLFTRFNLAHPDAKLLLFWLSLSVSLFISLVATAFFNLLWEWQYPESGAKKAFIAPFGSCFRHWLSFTCASCCSVRLDLGFNTSQYLACSLRF